MGMEANAAVKTLRMKNNCFVNVSVFEIFLNSFFCAILVQAIN